MQHHSHKKKQTNVHTNQQYDCNLATYFNNSIVDSKMFKMSWDDYDFNDGSNWEEETEQGREEEEA